MGKDLYQGLVHTVVNGIRKKRDLCVTREHSQSWRNHSLVIGKLHREPVDVANILHIPSEEKKDRFGKLNLTAT